jgi:hypothetical protein
MFNTDDPSGYLERAEMHEQLAASTEDIPARKMHQAMAAEYRRKAAEAGTIQVVPSPRASQMMKLEVPAL